MSEMKHTPEPWALYPNSGIYTCDDIADARGDCIAAMDSRGALAGKDEINANAARIVACVNALAGIHDPEAWVRERDVEILKYIGQAEDAEQAHKKTIAQVETLRARVRELEADRGRLDWLDEQGKPETFEDDDPATVWVLVSSNAKRDLREAIDAARTLTPIEQKP